MHNKRLILGKPKKFQLSRVTLTLRLNRLYEITKHSNLTNGENKQSQGIHKVGMVINPNPQYKALKIKNYKQSILQNPVKTLPDGRIRLHRKQAPLIILLRLACPNLKTINYNNQGNSKIFPNMSSYIAVNDNLLMEPKANRKSKMTLQPKKLQMIRFNTIQEASQNECQITPPLTYKTVTKVKLTSQHNRPKINSISKTNSSSIHKIYLRNKIKKSQRNDLRGSARAI